MSKSCQYHPNKEATDVIMVEGGGLVNVCAKCLDKILMHDRYVCKYCGIPIKSKDNPVPIGVRNHETGCPRRELYYGVA